MNSAQLLDHYQKKNGDEFNLSLFYCNNGCKDWIKPNRHTSNLNEFAFLFICPPCQLEWYVFKICLNPHKPITLYESLKRHWRDNCLGENETGSDYMFTSPPKKSKRAIEGYTISADKVAQNTEKSESSAFLSSCSVQSANTKENEVSVNFKCSVGEDI